MWSAQMMAQAQRVGIDAESAKWLLRRHGARVEQVMQLVQGDAQLAQRIAPDLPFIYADVLWCAQDEMVVHLRDLLRRRVPLLILARLAQADVRHLAELIAPALGWDGARVAQEVETCRQ